MITIKKFRHLLARLSNPLNVEIHEVMSNDTKSLIITITFLQSAWGDYAAAVEALTAYFKRTRKFIQTQEIVLLDGNRDGLTRRLVGRITSVLHYYLTDEEKAAAEVLSFVVENFKNMETKDYETNTVFISHMVADLEQPQYAPYVTALGLNNLLSQVKAVNTTFQDKYVARMHEMEKEKTLGTTADYRKNADEMFAKLAAAITGMQTLDIDSSTKGKLDQIVFKLNAAIDQYTRIYNRHIGLTASKDNNNGGGGTDVPDPEGPTDPQLPDITDPEAPFE